MKNCIEEQFGLVSKLGIDTTHLKCMNVGHHTMFQAIPTSGSALSIPLILLCHQL